MWCAVSVDARLNVNVALNRPSYQSSTYSDEFGTYIAANANDGNHGTHVVHGPCMCTTHLQTNPWWAVDLRAALKVHSVNFTNRDFLGTRLRVHCSVPNIHLMRSSSVSTNSQTIL